MNRHVALVHEGKEPFKCNICYGIFSGKSDMSQYILEVYEGRKLFSCDICDYSFLECPIWGDTGQQYMKESLKIQTMWPKVL